MSTNPLAQEFEGRAKWLTNKAGDGQDNDGQGHGTHVSGTIGSKTYGVAKKTKLFAVKVLDANGSGTNSAVLAGMDFVTGDAKNQDCPKGAVVNMSLGGSKSDAINQAAASIVDAGLFLAVAAGNEAADASTSSPASEEKACTVGATTKDDQLAEYSNFGKLVDILAPGTDILSTWPGGKTVSFTQSPPSPFVRCLRPVLMTAFLEHYFWYLDGHSPHRRPRCLPAWSRQGFPQGSLRLHLQDRRLRRHFKRPQRNGQPSSQQRHLRWQRYCCQLLESRPAKPRLLEAATSRSF